MTKRDWVGRLPMVCFMAVMVGVPLLYIVLVSFMTRGETGGVVYRFTTANYARLLKPLYLKIFAYSLGAAALTSGLTLAVGYPFAYFTARLPKNARFFVLLLVLMPFWTSSLLRTYGMMILLRTEGLINNVLLAAGLIHKPLKMMYTYGAVMAATVYMLLPFMILPVYNAIEKIDPHLLEAARDLGARKRRAFLTVTLPLSMSGVIGGVTLVFIPAVGLYFISDLLGGAKTILIGNLIADQMGAARNLPFAAAVSVVVLVAMMAFIGLFMNTVNKGDGFL